MGKKSWRGHAALFFVILVFLAVFPGGVRAEDTKGRVVRVGYPIQEGFTEVGEDGSLSGYTYEYLQEIAQYTGWEYEYVTVEGTLDEQLSQLLAMLETGEIDILGAMNYSDSLAEIFTYPEYSYGTAYRTLAVLGGNLRFTEFDYSSFDGIRVAVISRSGREDEKLNDFAAINGFRVEQVLCESGAEQLKLVKSGAADAVLGMDVSLENKDLRVVSRFASQPFYFAVTKGNREVAGGINKALEIISVMNPELSSDLYKKYFSGQKGLYLSEAEQSYIARAGTIKAGVLLGSAPIQYRKKDGTVSGISVGVLDYVEEQTGLEFLVVPFGSWEDYEKALKDGTIDMVIGVTDDYEEARRGNYTLTLPYLYIPLQMVMNDSVKSPSSMEGKRVALQKSEAGRTPAVGEPVYYDTLEECLEAVHSREADAGYGNSYSIQYYMASHNYKNLVTFAQSEAWSQRFCFGIRKPVDMTLLSIINKVVKTLPEEQVNRLLYENAYDAGEMTFSEYIMRNPQQSTLYLLLFWLAVITAVLISVEVVRRKNAARKALENERYEQLSELSNEFLYEYDIRENCLNLTEQTARFLGCEKRICRPERLKEEYSVFAGMMSQELNNTEQECRLPGGRVRWLKFISKMVTDSHGRPWYAVGKLVDIQKEREIKEQLEARAQRDSMTGVYNSATSHQLMRQALQDEERAGAGAMIIMDIDYFKQINDYLGHYTGDQVLCETAEILKACFRTEDIAGRLGGDEFVVFMGKVTEPEIVRQRCTEVLRGVRETTLKMHGKEVTLSIGAAMAGDSNDYDALYRRADQALYQVKKRGRNGVEVVS